MARKSRPATGKPPTAQLQRSKQQQSTPAFAWTSGAEEEEKYGIFRDHGEDEGFDEVEQELEEQLRKR